MFTTINMNYSKGSDGQDGVSTYLYVAYASDEFGADFSLSPSPSLKFRAEVRSNVLITNPTESTFQGASWIQFIGDTANTNYIYIAYAADDVGTGFTLDPSEDKPYMAILNSSVYIETPDIDDFDGIAWVKYIGSNGSNGGLFYAEFEQSLTIGIGLLNAVSIGFSLNYSIGQNIQLTYDESNIMYGKIVSYDDLTGIASIDVDLVVGSGTYSYWSINLSGGTPSVGTVATSGDVEDEDIPMYDGVTGSIIKSSGIKKSSLNARATYEEINSGTDDTKPITSEALALSNYITNDEVVDITNKRIDANSNTIINIGSEEIVPEIITGLALKPTDVHSLDLLMIVDSEDESKLKKVVAGSLPTIGERNTASNDGMVGVGVFKEKVEAELIFHRFVGGSEIDVILEDGLIKIIKNTPAIQEFVVVIGPGERNTVASRILDEDTSLEESWAAYDGTEFTSQGTHETADDLVIVHNLNKMLVDFKIWEYSPTGSPATEFYSNVSFDQDDHIRSNNELTRISIKDICTYVTSGKHIKLYLKFM